MGAYLIVSKQHKNTKEEINTDDFWTLYRALCVKVRESYDAMCKSWRSTNTYNLSTDLVLVGTLYRFRLLAIPFRHNIDILIHYIRV